MIVLLIKYKVIHIQNVAHVDEAVSSVGLGAVVVVVGWQLEIVEVPFVIDLEVLLDFCVEVLAWNVFHHQVSSSLFSS